MRLLLLPLITLLAAIITFVTNWLALIPWRRSAGQHWTERARVLFPARVTAASNLWTLPAITVMAALLWFPDQAPHWALVLLFSATGAFAGSLPMNREIFPRITPRLLLRLAVIGWITRFLSWSLLIGAIAMMPDEFNLQCLFIAAAVVAILILWTKKGLFWFPSKIGTLIPAPERLLEIVRATSARLNIPCDRVLFIRSPSAQALAFPGRRTLLFTDRIFEILTDDELAAVTAHELGHLAEPRSQWLKRYVVWFTFLPWIFIKPASETFGPGGIAAVIGTCFAASFAFRRVAHAMEVRADTTAHAAELNPGAYARALTKIYEDNLIPAVNAKKRATHPSLYDRLIAAGVTPDFPRPKPATTMTVPGTILSIALGVLFVLWLNHLYKPQGY